MRACRKLIDSQISEFRSKNKEPERCIGCSQPSTSYHVDHEEPTFLQLVTKFVALEGGEDKFTIRGTGSDLNSEDSPYEEKARNTSAYWFEPPAMGQRWQEYHRKEAKKLRYLCPGCNTNEGWNQIEVKDAEQTGAPKTSTKQRKTVKTYHQIQNSDEIPPKYKLAPRPTVVHNTTIININQPAIPQQRQKVAEQATKATKTLLPVQTAISGKQKTMPSTTNQSQPRITCETQTYTPRPPKYQLAPVSKQKRKAQTQPPQPVQKQIVTEWTRSNRTHLQFGFI